MTPQDTLKPGWKTWRFDQMAVNVNDRIDNPSDANVEHYVGLEHLDPESLKIRRWGSPSDVEATKLLFRKGDIIFGRRRAYQRKLAVADFDGICSAHAMVLRAKPEVVLPKFLPFFMHSDLFMNRAMEISVGSLSPTINWKTLAAQEFALPPLEEQWRIAELLSAAVLAKDDLQTLVESVYELWQSTASHYFAMDSMNTVRLGDLLVYASDGPFGSKLKTEHYANSGAQVIRLQNFKELDFDNGDQAYISETYYQNELSGYTVKAGDVLVAGLGDDNVKAGRACIAPNLLIPMINKADCYCLRPHTELSPEFLVCFLNSPIGLLQSMSFSQGTTRHRLNLGNIKRMQVPFPSLATQLEIASILFSIHEAATRAKTRYAEQQVLLNALLNRLL